MRIWHITDTHGFHDQLVLPEGIDMIIHTGDCANSRVPALNEGEVWKFIDWFHRVPVMLKIFVPGNHDTSIEHGLVTETDIMSGGIIPLINSSLITNGIKIFGSPHTPTFSTGWSYMKARDTINRTWEELLTDDINILLTHGPPKGILDLTENRDYQLEQVGDSALHKKLRKLPNLTHHLFGHIHNMKSIINTGIRIYDNITYSNASAVEDGKFSKGIIHNGNIIEI